MIEVPLANGRGVALVDDADAFVLAHGWHLNEWKGCRYARSSRVGYMHRLLMEPGPGMTVDHIDGDGLNNQRSNLRVVTHAQNHQNRHRQAGRRSSHRGVSWHARRGRWLARCKVGGVEHFGGWFEDELDAARAAAALRDRLMEYAA